MDQDTKEKTLGKLTKSENILIVVAKNLDSDGLASGLALYLSLAKLGKNVAIQAQTPTVGEAQRIYAVDRIGKVDGSVNPVIVIKDAVETVDKVSYFLESDELKVIIHPLPGSRGITPEQVSLQYTTTQPNLIFAIGFESKETLEKEIPHEHKITPDTLIISINNKQTQQKFAQYEFTSPQSDSISEATAIALQELALPIDEDIAYNLYVGIADSTNNFNPAKTTGKTFEIAGWLIKFGAGRASLAAGESRRASFAAGFVPLANQFPINPSDFADHNAPIEEVESLPESKSPESGSRDWLKPPKIYKGSKSFDGENKG